MRTRFEVLVVCTANVSRSPMAVALLRHRLTERFGEQASAVRVTSAGTSALVGEPVDPEVPAVLSAVLGPVARSVAAPEAARQVDTHLVGAADLVLTMTREQRGAVIGLVPAAQRKTFTVVELARIARMLGQERRLPSSASAAAGLKALVAAAPAWRGPTAPADPATDDVEDVHRARREVQVKAARRLDEALTAVVGVL
ncbi:low molecular weight phosphatase family protein [Kineococcus rhizosphaerae]|uniref:protein-tyrosine-phosphatase n=1 Tax=Kineococcus rhizosphaerae TaxID=559628 RepID=A0A2T0QYH4_9ACTN|nr:low molecular weight phosphatase family protein [Kineococcus rhizosphaerae]PRY11423.1 protein-tyrosine phosphatase [Kineococcus rhizosphaerae]